MDCSNASPTYYLRHSTEPQVLGGVLNLMQVLLAVNEESHFSISKSPSNLFYPQARISSCFIISLMWPGIMWKASFL
jgi:hypothetical protein